MGTHGTTIGGGKKTEAGRKNRQSIHMATLFGSATQVLLLYYWSIHRWASYPVSNIISGYSVAPACGIASGDKCRVERLLMHSCLDMLRSFTVPLGTVTETFNLASIGLERAGRAFSRLDNTNTVRAPARSS